jgi:mannose-6-phosphate isomerase-like protein (cupin superfamily)
MNSSSDRVLDCSNLGFVMSIIESSTETKGEKLVMEWKVLPHSSGTPTHVHKHAKEIYEVINGELEILVQNSWHVAKAGDVVRVEKGAAHTFRNVSGEIAVVRNTHSPALRFEQFFRELRDFSNSGNVKDGKLGFKSVISLSMLWRKYSHELTSVSPPAIVMRVLNGIGKLFKIA